VPVTSGIFNAQIRLTFFPWEEEKMASTRFRILACSLAFPGALAIQPARAQDLLIGQVSSQTSPVTAVNAKGLFVGFNVYLSHINAKGGIDGRKIKLINKDDQLIPGKMTEMTKEFIADKHILALAAYQNTAGITELAKLNVAGNAGIAMIAPFQGDKSIVSAPNFFPFRTGYPNEVVAMIKEAYFTQKKKVVVIYQAATYGPAMMQLAQEASKKEGLNVVSYVKMDTAAQDKLDAVIKGVVAATVKETPDAVILLLGGRPAPELVKQLRSSAAGDAQLYLMSVVPPTDVVKVVGEARSRGIVISQAVPFPFSATLPLVGEYQKLMKQYAPDEPLSFSTLEGFVAGKITVEALRRASPRPTREKVLKALTNMGELNLGGVYVNYTPKERKGWGGVDLTVIGPNGKLLR
jgi:branched-chain amino acid transport system substrate-binding protein